MASSLDQSAEHLCTEPTSQLPCESIDRRIPFRLHLPPIATPTKCIDRGSIPFRLHLYPSQLFFQRTDRPTSIPVRFDLPPSQLPTKCTNHGITPFCLHLPLRPASRGPGESRYLDFAFEARRFVAGFVLCMSRARSCPANITWMLSCEQR